MRDELGARMKDHEAAFRQVLPARCFMIVRVDGRSFHRYTRRLSRPFDQRLAADLDRAAVALVRDVAGARCAYVQSDEISVIATDLGSDTAQLHFGGVVQKIASTAAATVTAEFNAARVDLGGPPATFDGRVFAVGELAEVAAYLRWRQADSRRNAVSALVRHHLGPRAGHGVPTRDRIAALAAAGVHLDAVDPGFVHGRVVYPVVTEAPVTFVHKRTGETVTLEGVRRREWRVEPAPDFADGGFVAAVCAPAGPEEGGDGA